MNQVKWLFLLVVLTGVRGAGPSALSKCPPVAPGTKIDKNCQGSSVQSPANCVNRTVTVYAAPGKFADIQQLFMMFSNLPYQTTALKNDKKQTVVAISYWGEGPDSFALASRVKVSLATKVKEWGIEKISAEFDPNILCP